MCLLCINVSAEKDFATLAKDKALQMFATRPPFAQMRPGVQNPNANDKGNWWLLLGFVFALLILGGVVAALLLGKRTAGDTKSDVTSVEKPQSGGVDARRKTSINNGGREQKIAQFCANATCSECEDGWGPDADDQVDDDSIAAGFPPCSLRRAFLYKQSPLVDWGGKDYAAYGQAKWSVCKKLGAEPAPDNFTFAFSRKPNYNALDERDAEQDPANRIADPWLSRAPFSFLMQRRQDDSETQAIARGGKSGYITCRKRGLAIPEREPRAETCRAPGKENFQPPECAVCAPGYGPEPPADNACQQEYVLDYQYRLLPACFEDGEQERRACGADAEFVESVPQGSSTDADSPLFEFQSYALLYEKIAEAQESFGDVAAMRAKGFRACAPGQSGLICRRSAYVPQSDLETAEQTLFRESKPLETRKVERDREARESAEQWQADKSVRKELLETNVQHRVLIDERTGDYGPGFSGKFVSFYRDEFGELPVLSDQASAYFDTLSPSAKQNLALQFVGPQGTLNDEQQQRVCAVRRDLADFRIAIARYLEQTFEGQSWPPRTIPPVLDSLGGTQRLVCL
jgi:hypothetical protein